MKRFLILFVCLALLLCACKKTNGEVPSHEALTWQAQYDLGIRYLSEGNYEEAIIAFLSALEIDPKRSEAYAMASNAYQAAGNLEQAIAILEQGVSVAGSDDLQKMLDEFKVSQNNSPTIPTVLSELHFIYRSELYVELPEDVLSQFTELITIGQTGNQDETCTLLQSESLLRAIRVTLGKEDDDNIYLWTMLDDAILSYMWNYDTDPSEGWFQFEYRPSSGTIFFCSMNNDSQDGHWWYAIGSTRDHLWNGTFTKSFINYWPDDTRYGEITGTANDELVHGEYVRHLRFQSDGRESTSYEQFEQGLQQACWLDEQSGKMATTKYVDDYGISYGYANEDAMKMIEYVTLGW